MPTQMNSEATLPPGPKGHFLVGSLPMLADNVLATLENWAREYGYIFFYRAAGLRVCYPTHPGTFW